MHTNSINFFLSLSLSLSLLDQLQSPQRTWHYSAQENCQAMLSVALSPLFCPTGRISLWDLRNQGHEEAASSRGSGQGAAEEQGISEGGEGGGFDTKEVEEEQKKNADEDEEGEKEGEKSN